MAQLVDRLLRDPVPESGRVGSPEACERDHRGPPLDAGEPEHEAVRPRVQVRGGDPEDPVPIPAAEGVEQGLRAVLVPFRVERLLREWGRAEEDRGPEVLEVVRKVLEDALGNVSQGPKGDPHPFTTPRGTMRATIFVSPAPSAIRTTCSTSLYAPGASSTIPAFEAAWR